MQRQELETCLAAVERRGYELILAAQNALWVLEREDAPVEFCPEPFHNPEGLALQPCTCVDDVEPTAAEDPLEALYRNKIAMFRALIQRFLGSRMAPEGTQFCEERREILWTFVRRAIFQDASLMFLAQHFDNVETFLASDLLDVTALEKLCDAMRNSLSAVFHTVADVVRTDKDGKRVTILGGDVYETSEKFYGNPHIWYHLLALGACYRCMRKNTCRTVCQIPSSPFMP
jgi:hypothetical protein